MMDFLLSNKILQFFIDALTETVKREEMKIPLNKEYFKIALAASGNTIIGFARAHRVSDIYLHLIMQGKRTSKGHRIEKAMQNLIDIEFNRLRFIKIAA